MTKVNLKRLENEVVKLEEQPILKGKCILYGDSLFTRWKTEKWENEDAQTILRGVDKLEQSVVNHGFGSSTAEELLYYYPRLIHPYDPKALVVSVFGNDWAFGYSANEIFFLVSRVIEWARTDFEGIKLFICTVNVGISENRSKERWKQVCNEYNMLIRMYAEAHEDCQIIDLAANPTLFDNPSDCGQYDKVRKDIFIEDNVHFNQKGYKIFGGYMKKCLTDIL